MNFTTDYQVIEHSGLLSEPDLALLECARMAVGHSYSPYSNFKVGAAIVMESGQIITGFNIENASYPVCLCAEQTTIAAVKTQFPGQIMKGMAITVRSANQIVNIPATPCGQCRQLLFEQERINGESIRLILQGMEGPIWIFDSVSMLLPHGFSGKLL
jgi:cytidine deaminase